MKGIPSFTVLMLLISIASSGCVASSGNGSSKVKLGVSRIPVREVPKAALDAAEHRVPGIYIHAASINRHLSGDVYELRGLSHHTHYDIYVTAEGHIQDIDHDKWLSD